MAALDELCRASDVVTYEFENVPAEILRTLDDKYHIKQGIAPLCDSQDRLREKTRAVESGLECPRFADITDIDSLRLNAEAFGYPCVLKTRRLGYDGHGQKVIRSRDDIADAAAMLSVPCILEEYVAVVDAAVAFERYCVFVAAVARRGEAALLRRPLVELDILLVRCGGALAPLGRSDVFL